MKKLITCLALLFLFLASQQKVNAQTTIQYDFYTKKLTYSDESNNPIANNGNGALKIKKNDGAVKIKVININTLLYDVKVDINDKEINNTPPKLLTDNLPNGGGSGGGDDEKKKDSTIKEEELLSKLNYYQDSKKILEALSKLPIIDNDITTMFNSMKGTDRQRQFLQSLLVYEGAPIFCKGDLVEVAITITPKENEDKQLLATLKGEDIKVEIAPYKYLDVSFSSGFAASLLKDDAYNAKPNYAADTVQNYTVIKEDLGNVTLGPIALMHLSYKAQHVAYGGHIGVVVPVTESAKPQYLFGVSLLIGNKNRVGLNASYAFGQVKRLSATTDFDRKYTDSPTINTVYKWEGNFAFSLTYNIFNP